MAQRPTTLPDDLAGDQRQEPATGLDSQIRTSTNSPLYQQSEGSSGLSSVPSTISSPPNGLFDQPETRPQEDTGATRSGSPVRRSKRDRKVTARYKHEIETPSNADSKRQKVGPSSDNASSPLMTVSSPQSLQTRDASQAVLHTDLQDQHSDVLMTDAVRDVPGRNGLNDPGEPCIVVSESNSRSEPLSREWNKKSPPKYPRVKDDMQLEVGIANAFLAKVQDRTFVSPHNQDHVEKYLNRFPTSIPPTIGLDHEGWKCDELYPGFDRMKPIYYHADGITKTASSTAGQPGSNQESEAPSPSTKGGKGFNLGKAGKGHAKLGKAIRARLSGGGGGGGSGGGGRDRDSPEPSNKVPMTQEDKGLLAHIRARQAELRRFYATVVVQQREALELMALRDLTRMLRKQRAHTKLPAYNEVIAQLQQTEKATRDIVYKEYDMQIALAKGWKEAQEEVIESQYQKRVLASKEEHTRGAQGDLIIFHKAHRAAGDDTKTDNGSDLNGYFPRYHEMPEPNTGPRGYSSSRINDEKSFKEHLASYDEQAQRDIIEDDIVGPVVQSVAEQNARRQAEEERKIRFETLVSVAEKELNDKEFKEKPGYLIPRPLYPSENPQFALSRLADCAEYVGRAHSTKAYVYMPIAPIDVPGFPLHHLERIAPPMPSEATSLTPTAIPQPTTQRKPAARRNKSLSVSVKRQSKEEEPQSQSSSSTSTPLAAIAPAPSRMPPPLLSSQHHHHLPPQYRPPYSNGSLPSEPTSQPSTSHHPIPVEQNSMHLPTMAARRHSSLSQQRFQHPPATPDPRPVPPSSTAPELVVGIDSTRLPITTATLQESGPYQSSTRPTGLAPVITSRPFFSHISPPMTPTSVQTPIMPVQQPQLSPGAYGPGPMPVQYGSSVPQHGHYPPPGSYQQRPSYPPLTHQPPPYERPPPRIHSPIETATPIEQSYTPRHFSVSTSTSGPPRSGGRIGGPRRAPGEITFTNVQTPSSERFRSPSQPPANQLGQAVLRPGAVPNTPNGSGTGKIANTFVNGTPDANSRSQQAAEAARANAMVNAGMGAGPKGGRRVLLPKGHRSY